MYAICFLVYVYEALASQEKFVVSSLWRLSGFLSRLRRLCSMFLDFLFVIAFWRELQGCYAMQVEVSSIVAVCRCGLRAAADFSPARPFRDAHPAVSWPS